MRGEQYFEVQVVRINEVQFDNRVLIGFHHIDDIIAEEERKQYELQQALERTEASNEVLLAISKIYYEIRGSIWKRIHMSKSIRNGRFIRKKKEPAVHLRM